MCSRFNIQNSIPAARNPAPYGLRVRRRQFEVQVVQVLSLRELVRWAFEHQSALEHHQSAAGASKRDVELLLDEQDGEAVALQLAQSCDNLGHDHRRKPEKRLV